MLSGVDLSLALEEDAYHKLLKRYQKDLRKLAYQIHVQNRPVVIVFEGCQVSGKSDVIRCLADGLDPRSYYIYPGGTLTDDTFKRHYLWRFWKHLPEVGQIAIFDRSWYGRVMDDRLDGNCTEEQCKRAYREINNFERQLLNYGTVIAKFWLHIDHQEHERRLEAVANDQKEILGAEVDEKVHNESSLVYNPGTPDKWTGSDWCSHDRWNLYQETANEMLLKTSTTRAPWTVVESNSVFYARIKTLKTLVIRLKVELKSQDDRKRNPTGVKKVKKKKQKKK